MKVRGEAAGRVVGDEAKRVCSEPTNSGEALLEAALTRENMVKAWQRVKANKGSAGSDGLSIDATWEHLKTHWSGIRESLLDGTYRPQPVRRVMIPKPDGSARQLGIPTVTDRLIQQSLLQVLQPLIDPTFSAHSYGFRRERSAHQAVLQASGMCRRGGRMRYLQAGILAKGLVVDRHEGTPQGGPLSPLLANVLLDEVDPELERRGPSFVRYADDCNVYVRSQRAGERVLGGLRALYGRLKLKLNEAKSAEAKATARKFLGFSFYWHKGQIKRRVAPKALETFKVRIRQLTRHRTGGGQTSRVSAGLEELLPSERNARRVPHSRRMAAPPPAGDTSEALEAGSNGLCRADRAGRECRGRHQGRAEHALLVGQRLQASYPRLANQLL